MLSFLSIIKKIILTTESSGYPKFLKIYDSAKHFFTCSTSKTGFSLPPQSLKGVM